MTVAEIEELVTNSLRQYLLSVKKEIPEMNENTKPVGDLGLESIDGIAWVCNMEEAGFNVPNDVNPFVRGKGPDARNIKGIAELLQKYEARK